MEKREIKFRAWDKKQNKFTYVTLHPQQINWASPDFKESFLLNQVGKEAEAVRFEDLEDWQQFTGLKDKNGKEIYEGDIVKYKGSAENFQQSVVTWSQPTWSFTPFTKTKFGNKKRNFEIIGNIYKNKELLK